MHSACECCGYLTSAFWAIQAYSYEFWELGCRADLLIIILIIDTAGPKRPKLALLGAMRQKSATATKQALSSLHDAGAPEVPDLDPAEAAAPSTLASEMPMTSPEEGKPLYSI